MVMVGISSPFYFWLQGTILGTLLYFGRRRGRDFFLGAIIIWLAGSGESYATTKFATINNLSLPASRCFFYASSMLVCIFVHPELDGLDTP